MPPCAGHGSVHDRTDRGAREPALRTRSRDAGAPPLLPGLGDRLWRDYGFIDAFSLASGWYSAEYLAVNQGPIIVMFENFRSGLLWDLFMGCPEIQTALRALGFESPRLPVPTV